MDGLLALFIVFWLIRALNNSAKKKMKAASPTANRLVKEKPVQPQPAAPVQPAQPEKPAMRVGEGDSRFVVDPDVRQAEYMGSMLVDSDEGEDACDPSLAHDRPERMDPQSVYAHEIGAEPLLDLSLKGLYQGVVMSEILTRPAQRARRGR